MTARTPLSLPSHAAAAIAAEIRSFGRRNLETGGFLLAPYRTVDIQQVALAGTTGIKRRHNQLQISPKALARLFDYADDHAFYAPAQFHSHQTTAFLSHTDATLGLRVEGFTTTVIPAFAEPPTDPAEWGWWTFRNPTWMSAPPARLTPGQARIIRFDENGIEDQTHAY